MASFFWQTACLRLGRLQGAFMDTQVSRAARSLPQVVHISNTRCSGLR